MSYSDSFPSSSPVFQANFSANGGRIDPRMTFSRASTGSYFGTEKVLSSENLVLHSENYNSVSWTTTGVTLSGSVAAPDGTSTAWTLTPTTGATGHFIQQSLTINANNEYTAVAHIKAGAATHGWVLLRSEYTTYCYAQLEFSTSTLTTGGAGWTGVTGTKTELGSGWFKITLTGTAPSSATSPYMRIGINDGTAFNASGYPTWTPAGTETLLAWGAQVNTTGATVYDSPTTTQIARSYQTKLQTAASGAARFEHSASDGQSAGTSRGILIEGQSSNLATYGSDLTNAAWNPLSAFIGGTAVGPDGTLSAVKLVASAASGLYPRFRRLSLLTDTTQTFSIYVKPLEFQHLAISADGSTSSLVQYNLSGNGAITSATGATGAVEQCGNGWFRVSFSYTTVPNAHLAITMQSSTTYQAETGNGYDGMLFALAQLENQSFASSFIGTTSSTATRAAESLSVDTADIGYTGGPVSVVAEVDGGRGNVPYAFSLSDGTYGNRVYVNRNSSSADESTDWFIEARVGGASVASIALTSSAAAGKLGVSYDTNSVSVCASGGAVITDTTAPLLHDMTKLQVGAQFTGNFPLNGHVKRVALYNEALSDTNLQALTS